MALDDLFNKNERRKKPLKKRNQTKEEKKQTEVEDNYVKENKETLQTKVENKIQELTEKAKPKFKSSIYDKIDKEDIYLLAELINTKVMSYKRALEKIKEYYEEDIPEIKDLKWQSFRYYMIKREIIDRPNSLKSINKAISKSAFAQSRRERIIEDVIEELFDKHIERLVEEFKKRGY